MPNFNYQAFTREDLLKHHDNGDNALHMACRDGNLNELKLILTRAKTLFSPVEYKQYINTPTAAHVADGTLVDTRDTGLMLACSDGNLEVTSYLLSEGADVTLTSTDNLTPLQRACLLQKPAVVSILLSHQDSLSSVISNVDTVGQLLFYGCQFGKEKLVKYLLENMTDYSKQEKNNMLNKSYPVWFNEAGIDGELTPLQAAYLFRKSTVAKLLIANELVNVNIIINGKSLISQAILNRRLYLIEALLQRHDIDVDFNIINEKESIIGLAIRTRLLPARLLALNTCNMLLNIGINQINHVDPNGFTALDRAIDGGLYLSHPAFIENLLVLGARRQQTLPEIALSKFHIPAYAFEEKSVEEISHAVSSYDNQLPEPSRSYDEDSNSISPNNEGLMSQSDEDESLPSSSLAGQTSSADVKETPLPPEKRSAPFEQKEPETKRVCQRVRISGQNQAGFFPASRLLPSAQSSSYKVPANVSRRVD